MTLRLGLYDSVDMNTFYELIHLPSGNVVGDFDTQDNALRALGRITGGEQ